MIPQALTELGVIGWVLIGNPTTEEEFNENFKQYDSSNPAAWDITWAEVKAKADELAAALPLKQLRAKRDQLIAVTDWWASSDITMSAERTAYRQALRDITNTYTSLEDVVWPTKPE